MKSTVLSIFFCSFLVAAQDMPLSQILIDGEDWKLVADGYGFTDAACADAEGNFYFSDMSKSTIHSVSPEGKVTAFLEQGPKISGLKFAARNRLIACTQGPAKQVVAIALPSQAITVLADNVQPNDLAVSGRGVVYFTE